MLRIISILSLIALIPQLLSAQVLPKEGSTLNYKLVGFSFPPEKRAKDYTLEIAAGYFNSEESFKKSTISIKHSNTSKLIAEVPSFGSSYTWRVIYTFGRSSKTISALFHFSTGTVPAVDTTLTRLRVINPAVKYEDAYVFLEGNNVLYDMTGNPVWYLPQIEGQNIAPADMKLSPTGTITFIASGFPYEINYGGDVIWKISNNDQASGSYHHEFTKIDKGRYMVLGNETVDMPSNNDIPGAISDNTKNATSQKIRFGTIEEYDENRNVVWSWRSLKYFNESDIINYQLRKGRSIDIHDNSFYFDEVNKTIYLSCKGISRVVKIKYPEGSVINSYGETFKPGFPEKGNGLFCGQHCVRLAEDGSIFLFNNNGCNAGAFPEIVKLQEPVPGQDTLKRLWKYECTADINAPNGFPSGGNATELPDHSLFVATAAPDSKVFIVNMNKDILWSAISEKWNGNEKKWEPLTHYRASIIKSREDMERLVWSTEIHANAAIKAIYNAPKQGEPAKK